MIFFLISLSPTLFILNFCHFSVCFSCNLKSVCVLIYSKCGEYRFNVCVFFLFWQNGIPFIFAVLKRFVVCVNFVGFGYGIFDLWIQFREYVFDDANVPENGALLLWRYFSQILLRLFATSSRVNRNNSTVCIWLVGSFILCRSCDGMHTL